MIFSEACRAVDLLVSVTGFAIEQEKILEVSTVDGQDGKPAGDNGIDSLAPSLPDMARYQRLNYLADFNMSHMAQMRRNVLLQVFAPYIANGAIRMEERHACVGLYKVHLATARVTCEGAAVDVALLKDGHKLAAVPWLPYDEALLQKIADTVGVLLQL